MKYDKLNNELKICLTKFLIREVWRIFVAVIPKWNAKFPNHYHNRIIYELD